LVFANVTSFQDARGLKTDGVIGPKTQQQAEPEFMFSQPDLILGEWTYSRDGVGFPAVGFPVESCCALERQGFNPADLLPVAGERTIGTKHS
jgi:hypothetical protein